MKDKPHESSSPENAAAFADGSHAPVPLDYAKPVVDQPNNSVEAVMNVIGGVILAFPILILIVILCMPITFVLPHSRWMILVPASIFLTLAVATMTFPGRLCFGIGLLLGLVICAIGRVYLPTG